jgi:chromosome segregation ATPase
MIEPIMFFGIGFLVASLLTLIFIPLVHGRAVRLTTRRLEAATPLSMAEIQAEKDQLRAEFAMTTRRLEISVEQMKAKTTSQLAELGKKTDAINRLKAELDEKTAAMLAIEAREKALKDQLLATEDEFSVKTGSLRTAESTLADKEAQLARLAADLDNRSVAADSQRIELVALRTQVEALKIRVADYEKEVKETGERLERERIDAAAAARELVDERSKGEDLNLRVADLERQLVAQTTEAEIHSRRFHDYEARFAEQARLHTQREHEFRQLRNEIEAARKLEADLRAELARAADQHRSATEGLRAEKALVEQQLEDARAERLKLQGEHTELQREAEATWAAERVEGAILRERIHDVAAEVARITAVLEGQGSPIETILASESRAGPNGPRGPNGEGGPGTAAHDPRGSLADRIRALQARASRVSPATN